MKRVPFIDQPLIVRRNQLKNKDFSIICSCCMAGFIYKQLGMKFLTPTINLYFTPADFIELLRHLHDYMESKLVEDKESDKNYPVGILERDSHPIKVYFQHYDNFKIAYEKWERRKSRINYNNIYVVADDDWRRPYSDKNINDFKQLPYQHKIIMVDYRMKLATQLVVNKKRHSA